MDIERANFKYIEGNLIFIFFMGFLTGSGNSISSILISFAFGIAGIVYLGWMIRKWSTRLESQLEQTKAESEGRSA